MTGDSHDQVPFEVHVDILRSFLLHRSEIVRRIEEVLNASRKPVQYLQDRGLLTRHFEDCFFTAPIVTPEQARLRHQLDEAHRASGFRPRQVPGLFSDLIHPAEMAIRGFHCWQQTRWPGRAGRSRYAQTLFNVYVLRCLTLLSMRIWDAGMDAAADRLLGVQAVLDQLWQESPGDQPALVRDARWLIPYAQSPTTDDLAAYFEVAERVAESLEPGDRLEMQKAHARMLGGHLTSQIRHYCMNENITIDDASIVRRTRTSNALDFALLIQCLVPLLRAYDEAVTASDNAARFELAGAVCQGISADPEVFLSRVDLLGAYSMLEEVFIETRKDGSIAYSHLGRRHMQAIDDYEGLIGRLRQALIEDCPDFRPVEGRYSPYGAIFGNPSNLTELLAMKTLQRDALTGFGLEDAFVEGDADPDRLAWADGWRKLPHVDPAVQKLFDYPQQFAEAIYDRICQCLQQADDPANAAEAATGRLYLIGVQEADAASAEAEVPAAPVRYIRSSDRDRVAAGAAEAADEAQLLRDRLEGHFVLSFETAAGWVAVSKDLLTDVIASGENARLDSLPPSAIEVLRLMCPRLVS